MLGTETQIARAIATHLMQLGGAPKNAHGAPPRTAPAASLGEHRLSIPATQASKALPSLPPCCVFANARNIALNTRLLKPTTARRAQEHRSLVQHSENLCEDEAPTRTADIGASDTWSTGSSDTTQSSDIDEGFWQTEEDSSPVEHPHTSLTDSGLENSCPPSPAFLQSGGNSPCERPASLTNDTIAQAKQANRPSVGRDIEEWRKDETPPQTTGIHARRTLHSTSSDATQSSTNDEGFSQRIAADLPDLSPAESSREEPYQPALNVSNAGLQRHTSRSPGLLMPEKTERRQTFHQIKQVLCAARSSGRTATANKRGEVVLAGRWKMLKEWFWAKFRGAQWRASLQTERNQKIFEVLLKLAAREYLVEYEKHQQTTAGQAFMSRREKQQSLAHWSTNNLAPTQEVSSYVLPPYRTYVVAADGACQFRASLAVLTRDKAWIDSNAKSKRDVLNAIRANDWDSEIKKSIGRAYEYICDCKVPTTKRINDFFARADAAATIYNNTIGNMKFNLYTDSGIGAAIDRNSKFTTEETYFLTILADAIAESINLITEVATKPGPRVNAYIMLTHPLHYNVMATDDYFNRKKTLLAKILTKHSPNVRAPEHHDRASSLLNEHFVQAEPRGSR